MAVLVTELGAPAVADPGARDLAARQLWDAHYGRLAGWCFAMVGDSEVAHEIAAESFTRLLTRWRTVHDPRGYLYITALNLVRDRGRGRDRDVRLMRRLVDATALTTADDQGWLHQLVDSLPEPTRSAVVLYYFADVSVGAVAKTIHRPEGTVKRLLAEGRAQLRLAIGDDDD
jgi:RNA polymerase sigma-70 factor (ECF subfamily)